MIGPALLFIPFANSTLRMVAVAGFVTFHAGLHITMELGLFPATDHIIQHWNRRQPVVPVEVIPTRGPSATSGTFWCAPRIGALVIPHPKPAWLGDPSPKRRCSPHSKTPWTVCGTFNARSAPKSVAPHF